MDVYIGLDVSLASTAICVLGEKGKIVTEAQVASAPDSLVAFMHELPHGIAVIGLEAGPLSSVHRSGHRACRARSQRRSHRSPGNADAPNRCSHIARSRVEQWVECGPG